MNSPASRPGCPTQGSRWPVLAAAGSIAGAALAAYAGSFHGAFLYDDADTILSNPTLRHFSTALFPPPGGLPVSGRPIANLSFAINYAISGSDVWSYHALNLLIHILAALTLFGVVRRTLGGWNATAPTRFPGAETGKRLGDNALPLGVSDSCRTFLAFLVALLWAVHPLQTEAVTYLSQRTESLMGLFFLLTLYCFIRGVEPLFAKASDGPAGGSEVERAGPSALPPRRTGIIAGCPLWLGLSFVACLLGMATKEVMATAPVIVFLYDRTFAAGSFGEAWQLRWRYYAVLAASWLLLALLVVGGAGRGGTAGFATTVRWEAYAFAQFHAVAHYLVLCLWPHPLVFDYGLIIHTPPVAMIGNIFLVAVLAGASAVLAWRGSPLGFLGAWFFLILAPSSSVVPVATEIVAEHRAYLPLAAVIAAVVCGGFAAAQRLGWDSRSTGRLLGFAGLAAALALGAATVRRNRVYDSVLALWEDCVLKIPDNPGARNNLGNALAERGRTAEAIDQFQAALRILPNYDDPHFNLGNALAAQGNWPEAAEHYAEALRYNPDSASIHYALGSALLRLGRAGDAERQFEQALEGKSDSPAVWFSLGNALLDTGRLAPAAQAFEKSLKLRPDFADALVNYGGTLAQLGRGAEAVLAFQAALRLQPNSADVHNNLGGLLAQSGRLAEAKAQFEEALRLQPDYAEARRNLDRVEAMEGEGNRQ